jgi:hypothetical protein
MHVDRIHRLTTPRTTWQATGLAALTLTLVLIAPAFRSVSLAQAPGPELFAKEPRTALELWDAVDYLLRTNQPKTALPYIDRFMKSEPDDTTLSRFATGMGPSRSCG